MQEIRRILCDDGYGLRGYDVDGLTNRRIKTAIAHYNHDCAASQASARSRVCRGGPGYLYEFCKSDSNIGADDSGEPTQIAVSTLAQYFSSDDVNVEEQEIRDLINNGMPFHNIPAAKQWCVNALLNAGLLADSASALPWLSDMNVQQKQKQVHDMIDEGMSFHNIKVARRWYIRRQRKVSLRLPPSSVFPDLHASLEEEEDDLEGATGEEDDDDEEEEQQQQQLHQQGATAFVDAVQCNCFAIKSAALNSADFWSHYQTKSLFELKRLLTLRGLKHQGKKKYDVITSLITDDRRHPEHFWICEHAPAVATAAIPLADHPVKPVRVFGPPSASERGDDITPDASGAPAHSNVAESNSDFDGLSLLQKKCHKQTVSKLLSRGMFTSSRLCADAARVLNLSRDAVTRAARDGMPLHTMDAARAWLLLQCESPIRESHDESVTCCHSSPESLSRDQADSRDAFSSARASVHSSTSVDASGADAVIPENLVGDALDGGDTLRTETLGTDTSDFAMDEDVSRVALNSLIDQVHNTTAVIQNQVIASVEQSTKGHRMDKADFFESNHDGLVVAAAERSAAMNDERHAPTSQQLQFWSTLQPFDMIDAQDWQGLWFQACIIKKINPYNVCHIVSDKIRSAVAVFSVHFIGWSKDFDERLSYSRIRPFSSDTAIGPGGPESLNTIRREYALTPLPVPLPECTRMAQIRGIFCAIARCDALDLDGIWYDAIVVKGNTKTDVSVRVHYNGWPKSSSRIIKRKNFSTQLRPHSGRRAF